MKTNKNIDDGIVEIMLGSVLIAINNFSNGTLIERIFVSLGFIIFNIGIFRTMLKYKADNKKGMMIFLIIMNVVSILVFIGLLYNTFF